MAAAGDTDAAAEPGLGVMPGRVKQPFIIPGNFCTLYRKCAEPFLIVKKRLVNRGRAGEKKANVS